MNLDEFKLATKEQLKAYADTIPFGYTYDSNNNELTYKDSHGYWRESTYDTNGKVLTYKNSDGANRIVLHKSLRYTLNYDIDSHKYVAGCKKLTYKECLAYYKLNKDEHEDAELFMKIIKEHHKSPKEIAL